MPPTYSLLVHSADGISWKSSGLHRKTPNLYVAIYQDGVEVQRTPMKRDLAPKWEHVAQIASESLISLRLCHHSSLSSKDASLGIVDIDIAALLERCRSDDPNCVNLQLTGVDGESKGRPAGALSVHLQKNVDTGTTAIEQARRDVGKLAMGGKASAISKTSGFFKKSMSTADSVASALDLDLDAGLSAITSKLDLIVSLGNQIATIHPYANMAWKILTAVHQAVKKQRETDDKIAQLVDTMVETYSFVEDIDFLVQKIKSLEDKTLALVKQTVECSLFIQEYTANGFCNRVVRNTWSNADGKIDDLSAALLKLKASFDGSLTVQSLFLSTKVLGKLEGLEQSDAFKKLNPVDMNASSRPLCLPGTRREILDYITEWVTVPSDSGSVLWLSGVAGSGKSTISTTVSDSFRAVERLGAFLFFDRNDRVRSHPDGVIRTLAYSLALSNPHIASAISAAIQHDPAVVNGPVRTQFKALLLDPLTSVESLIQGPILVILDAIDECGDRDSRTALLSTLATELPKLPRLFRFLITSRPEQDIIDRFGSCFGEKVLDTGASVKDVQVFLRHEMERIREERKLGPTWPEEQHMRALVNFAGGLFIWASTAARFIDGYRPNERLKTLIAQNSTNLDALYGVALRNSGPWDADEAFAKDARAVLACVVLGGVPMTDGTIDTLLGSGTQSAEVLKYLGCVVQWSLGGEARTLHASFADYLTDNVRSGGQPWTIDAKIEHRSLAAECLRILDNDLRFNICALEDSHILNADVHDISNLVATMISPQVSYSSCFWSHHVREAPFDDTILNVIDKFFHGKFLYWLEVLSLLGEVPVGSAALEVAVDYSKGHNADLEDFISDAIKFVSAFAPLIAQSAPHIYLSAVSFAPPESRIAQQLTGCFPNTAAFESALGTQWPSIQKVLNGHINTVTSVDFSPDGARIASGSEDWTVRVWDAQTGAVVTGPFEGNTSVITSVHFSPDGRFVVSGALKMVHIWDAQTGALVAGPLEGHTDWVNSVQFSPNGKCVASGCWDKTIRIWDAQSGVCVGGPFEGHTGVVNSVHFSPDGTRIASGSGDKTVRIWDVQTGRLVAGPFEGHTENITSVHFSPDGTKIASGSYDNTVRVWDAVTGALVAGPLEGHINRIFSVRFSPDGTRIASGAGDETVRVWDAQTGALVAGPFTGHTAGINSVHFSPDGARIASGAGDKTIRVWDAHTAARVPGPFEGYADSVYSIGFSADGIRLASSSTDGTIRVLDAETCALVGGPFEGHTNWVVSVDSSPDGTRIVSGAYDNTVRVWNAQTGALVAGPLEGHTNWVCYVCFSPDGTRIASGSADKTVRVWDAETGVLVAGPFEGHAEWVQFVDFSPDGTRIATGSDRVVRVWDTQTGTLVAGPFEGHTWKIASVHFSPDGMLIASGSGDCTVRVWDAQTGTLVAGPLEGHTSDITCVCFSPDGTKIASGSQDQTVRVWDAQTGALVAGPFEGHTAAVNLVQFSPDSRQIASASVDCTVRISKIDSLPENPLGNSPKFDSSTGWIMSAAGEFLLWVPPWLREGIYLPHNSLIFRPQGTTKLDLGRFVHGREWEKCIDPKFMNRK
ncbi:WD40 repeat-like protein [Mycena epipterygia]|nr:WD40 repeat-like protein [Mycena epipterygia]